MKIFNDKIDQTNFYLNKYNYCAFKFYPIFISYLYAALFISCHTHKTFQIDIAIITPCAVLQSLPNINQPNKTTSARGLVEAYEATIT